MKLSFIKTPYGLAPDDPNSKEWFEKVKLGQGIKGEFKRVRNYKFHKKLFALLNLAYEYWEPGEINTKWGKPQKHFETFRKNAIILAGYGEPVFNIDGTFKMEAKSISFANMDEHEFQDLYSKVLDVLLERSLKGMSRDEVEDLTEKFLSFA